jgi:ATP-dependent RNA helicase DDX27
MTAMARFTGLRAALIVGGAKNVMSQAAELRTRPDVVVATPGRLLDHITNSQGVDLDDVEFLILDEADRLLDLGFQDEVYEIIKSCPIERQTMLFSATMSTKVDELIKLSLKRPVRIAATEKSQKSGKSTSNKGVEVAPRLEQEFVRIRAGNEGVNREGMLLALLTRTFKSRVIVFFDTKSAAHRLMIVCGLCGIKCGELHGNLTQVQRLEALEAFREGSVDVLLCTDLAARGLDVEAVEAVVNFEMPSQVETYVHRIGRTARAGRGGKSCTLIGEGRRYLMKEVIKDAEEKNRRQKQDNMSQPTGVIRSRTIPPAVVAHFVAKINSLEPSVKEVMDAEAVARLDRITEMEAIRAKNIIEHSEEIEKRPKREWFASTKQKMSVKQASVERKRLMEEKVGTGKHRMTRKKRRAQEAREMLLEAKEESERSGGKTKIVFTNAEIKGSARASKRNEARREKESASRSLNDEDVRNKRIRKQKQKAVASDAAGDGGLFSEEKVAFSKKSKEEEERAPAKSSYFFKEYDPNKKRGKKKAHHAFKSRSKYKRR